MKRRRRLSWIRLDNAAKIFPSTTKRRANNVFRISCELTEAVDSAALQTAVDRTIEHFPIFQVVIKRGFFWYYLESTDLSPRVEKENRPPCSKIYNRNIRTLLFEVTYYEHRINLEVFHALTDGTGALEFFKTILLNYLSIRYSGAAEERVSEIDYDASYAQKSENSFEKYYDPSFKYRKSKVKAHKLKGTRVSEDRMNIIDGVMPVDQVLNLARQAGVTLTEYVVAILIESIKKEMPVRYADQPVVVSIPVNLRKYFDSSSARNFFGVIVVGQDMVTQAESLEETALQVRSSFKDMLTKENLSRRMSKLTSLEKNPFLRVVPLFLKDIILRIGKDHSQLDETCTMSNVGIINLPDSVGQYIERFQILNSTNKLQACLCTYGAKLSIAFTSAFVSTEIQKNFFRSLANRGVDIEILSNEFN